MKICLTEAMFSRRVIPAIIKSVRSLLAVGAMALPSYGWSYGECLMTPLRVYTDSNTVWITWTTGQATYVSLTDPAAKLYYAAGLVAMTTGRNMIVRIADGTTCAEIPASGMPMIGLWLI